MTLSSRVDRLEQSMLPAQTFAIRLLPDESMEQARARWLQDNPGRDAELERAKVLFIRRTFVDPRRPSEATQ